MALRKGMTRSRRVPAGAVREVESVDVGSGSHVHLRTTGQRVELVGTEVVGQFLMEKEKIEALVRALRRVAAEK